MSAGAHPTRHHPPAPGFLSPGFLLQLLEVRALWEHSATLAMRPVWRMAPRGDGHPVLVLPGLAAGDASTALLRRFLRSRGYAASGWGQGINLGLRQGVVEGAHEKLRELYEKHGRTVSVIGWSLGGLYARELAKHSPEMVRLCITMGTPFTGHPRETNAWRLYEFASGHKIDWHDFHGPMRAAPPVPTTSIWSPTDGVVAWRCSVETRRILAENIVDRREPPRPRRAPGGPLCDRRPARPAGGRVGALPSQRLAAAGLLRREKAARRGPRRRPTPRRTRCRRSKGPDPVPRRSNPTRLIPPPVSYANRGEATRIRQTAKKCGRGKHFGSRSRVGPRPDARRVSVRRNRVADFPNHIPRETQAIGLSVCPIGRPDPGSGSDLILAF